MSERIEAIQRSSRAYHRLKNAQTELEAAKKEYELAWEAFEVADAKEQLKKLDEWRKAGVDITAALEGKK